MNKWREKNFFTVNIEKKNLMAGHFVVNFDPDRPFKKNSDSNILYSNYSKQNMKAAQICIMQKW